MPGQHSSFLKGSGEMCELTRNYDWSKNLLGPISQWPVSLRVQVQMMLSSRFPMLIFWGPGLITFYNDAFRPSLGDNGKHPSSLGQPGEISWAESWPTIGPMIYNIMAGGDAVWFENQKLPLYRDGKLGYAYWTYSFSPISDDEGDISGVLVTCSETTKAVESLQELEQTATRLDNLFTQVSAGIAQTDLTGHFTEVNDRFCQMLGYSRKELLTKSVADITHPEDLPRNRELQERLIDQGEEFFISKRYIRKDSSVIWVNNGVTLVEDTFGDRYLTAISIDDTVQKLQELRIAESENRFQNLMRDASVGLIVLMGEDMRVVTVNDAYCKLIGHTVAETLHRPLFDVIPEAAESFLPILKNVLITGEPFSMDGATYSVHGAGGQLIEGFINFVYQPYREADGTITGVMAVVHDVTTQALAQQKIQNSEARFRTLIEEAPVATCLFTGRELTIALANELMLDLWGKNASIIGKHLADAVPELKEQAFLDILDQVFTTGESYSASAARAELEVSGILKTYYFNFTYKPLRNEAGEVYGIMNMALDVTEQVLAGKKLEEAEAGLRGAVDLAELATWTIDLEKELITYSPRLQEWLGLTEQTIKFGTIALVHERDEKRVINALKTAMVTGGDGFFDEVYTITNITTGQDRIIHSNGKTTFGQDGQALAVTGTSQDVTIQHELRLGLENEVQKRTEELAAAIEELRATNEELEAANAELLHSNTELAQYAYVASHDLQEPLRKIRVFTGMLRTSQTSEENSTIIEKISSSAERMTLLIQDLLSFSRLLRSETMMMPISLNNTVTAVWNDFELLAKEKNATIEIGELPVIEAVSLQMNQLFYNLISNALKFTMAQRAPHIWITSQLITQEEAGKHIPKLLPFCEYYHITVKDNGIGFETRYHEQIFEVFKRLHGRDLYPGSGIGLALCRRIAVNHQGVLYATSETGNGSTFHIILPAKQNDFNAALSDAPAIFPNLL